MKKAVNNRILSGTIRVKTKTLKPVIYRKGKWITSSKKFPELQEVVRLFKAHGKFDVLIDSKNPQFLKGQLSPEGKTQGARIPVLPDGRKLDKAFSLFAPELAVHDESSNTHWDVLYKNAGGTYSYVYTLDKDASHRDKKYDEVAKFEKLYPKIESAVIKSLNDDSDLLALAIYTLLKTYMRVGNEMYYKADGHKGLTTLKKEDVSVKGKTVTFSYLGKDGVPLNISHEFTEKYVNSLKHHLKNLKKGDYVFADASGKPLSDMQFKQAFRRYCGTAFYPHIVRSYQATLQSEDFLKKHKSATKQEVQDLFLSIADELGHKKFVKKTGQWEDSFTVTIHHYIKPEIVEKIQGLVK